MSYGQILIFSSLSQVMKETSKTLTYGRKCNKNHVFDFVHMSEMPTVNIKDMTCIFHSRYHIMA